MSNPQASRSTSLFDRYLQAVDEVFAVEAQLSEEDLSDYTAEAIDFEKTELTKTWSKYKKLYEECCTGPLDREKELAVVQAKHPKARRAHVKCINLISKAKKTLPVEKSVEADPVVPNRGFAVPPCDTGVFSGDYVSWPTFRDMFTAIYMNNSRLSAVEKLFYLFQKTDGEAREINRNVSLTAENFEIAWSNLRSQYENKRVLINSQLKSLFNLVPCQREVASEVKRLQREINNCISVLKLYEIDIESWDPIFVFQCSSRLPSHTLQLWEQSVKRKTEVPRWKELNNFLTDRYHALESVSEISASFPQKHSGSQTFSDESQQTGQKPKQLKAHHTKVDVAQCKLCKEAHAISNCRKFMNMDNRNRVSVLKKFKYCFNCLKTGHMYDDCTNANGCSKCKKKHHNLLHRDFVKKQNKTQVSNQIQSAEVPSASEVVQSHHTSVARQVMLATAWVNVRSCGSNYRLRALIDPCSDESFISGKMQRLLKLPTEPVTAEVTGLSGEIVSKCDKRARFTVESVINPNIKLNVGALVVSKVTGDIPTHSYSPNGVEELPKLDYADPDFYRSGQIDILFGGDLYPSILKDGIQHGIFGSLVAQNTIFGWIVTGPAVSGGNSAPIRVSHFTKVSVDDQLSKFWELEEVAHKTVLSHEDKKCEEIYGSTTVRDSDGRYIVNLPFKIGHPELGQNRNIALRQYERNEKSLMKKPEIKVQYDEVMADYLKLGHMRKVDRSTCGPRYFLPHHAVYKPDSATTKLRVVYNASSPSVNGVSLNDILYVGPTLQSSLVSLISKWRLYKYVFNADITKMYRQILVNPEHAVFQGVLYRSSEEEEVENYQLHTVTFGVNCAPYLALRTLKQLAMDEKDRFPVSAEILRSSMYVDDVLYGAHSITEALVARDELIAMLKCGGFDLRKWTSNCSQILAGLPSDVILSSSFLALDDKSTVKTLGLRWNAASDEFYFVTEKIMLKTSYTRREVLSVIARLFDPIGWLSPIIVRAKILIQQMWLDKGGWDDPISVMSLQKWRAFVSTFNEIDAIKIPRWIGCSSDCYVEFHAFCDASELAYAAALYMRVQIGDNISTNLLVAKTKVAPIKKITLPRLELCGAVLLATLVDQEVQNLKLKNSSLYLWSDATIVLAWLKKSPCNWKTFVAHRVGTILEKVGNKEWRHVASNENPADLATRGLTPGEVKDNKLWWHGPIWLNQHKSNWPATIDEFETSEESKNVQTYVAQSAETEDMLNRFSCLAKGMHVIAYMFRFYTKLRQRAKRSSDFEPLKISVEKVDYQSQKISAEELSFVKIRLFLLSQKAHFREEYSCLEKKSKINPRSALLTLTPFLDKHGIIRANGRLGSTKSLSYNERHPIVLAYGSRLARLYVDFIHKMVLHGGPRLVLNTVRQECWILKAKNLIKTCIHNCKPCVLYKKKLQGQIMGELPTERTTFSRPFTNTGVDFAGPFELKSFTGRYTKITKGYACVFVCFSTKAIHIEVVSDLSTPAFLAAFARFISRRGCPSKMFSDNGRNFVGSARQIDANFVAHVKDLQSETVSKYGHNALSWHFIPAAAPHMGGLWEAGVKSLKMHLKKSAGQIKLTFEEFSTLLAKIEACLNSRPLSALSEDVNDQSALTPAHFLIGSSMLTPAEPEELGTPDSILNRWRKLKALHQEFCRRWKEEYLQELHKRTKWKNPQINLVEGDLVVLRNEPLCPTDWRLGRVVKVYHGRDGRVRVADLKTQNGLITRPIHKLVLLPRSPS